MGDQGYKARTRRDADDILGGSVGRNRYDGG